MPDWPPIFEEGPETHARRYDPDTSHRTARRIKLRSQAIRVLNVYVRTGRDLCDFEAYRLAGFPPGRTSHQRCSDLRDWGLIYRTGERGQTPSGNSAHRCRASELGVRFALGLLPGLP